MRLHVQKYFHPRSYQLLRIWFVMFYLHQISIHDNQLMLLPQNWYSTRYTVLQCISIAPFYSCRKINSMVQTFSLLERCSKKKCVPTVQKQLSDFMETSNKLFDIFCHDKNCWRELELKHPLHYICLTFSFILWRPKRKEIREMCSVPQCRTVQLMYIAILYIQCYTSFGATASADYCVRQFGSDITWQITSSVVGNFWGGIIFVLANEWISCNTIVLVLFPLVNMLMEQAMSTSRLQIKSKNRIKNIEIHGNSNNNMLDIY